MSAPRIEKRLTARFLAVVGLLAMVVALAPSVALAKGDAEKFRANGIIRGAVGPGASSVVDIKISRWTTEEEREDLLEALRDKGTKGLYDELRKQKKAGFFQIRGEVSYRTLYNHQIVDGSKRRIVIATDRPIEFMEVYDRDISLQFPIALAVIDFDDEKGTGEGIVMYGAELVYNEDKDTLEITNFAQQPVLLGDVRKLQ